MGVIYRIDDDNQLTELHEHAYESEFLLQELLVDHPDLLAGDQIDDIEPRRWLLVSREMGLASDEETSERWAVDHLFLDQDGIPTLVEVKRGTDTRIRRKVVGQMLDYAANAVVYWPVETIQRTFEGTCEEREPDRIIEDFLAHDEDDRYLDPNEFWAQVETNLEIGKVRLLFVADQIPRELQRIVEFLNEQMKPAEVLAVEIKQYVNQDGLRTLVPRIVGQTAEAQRRKSSSTSDSTRQWDEITWFDAFKSKREAGEVKIVRRVQEWVARHSLGTHYSSQRKDERATLWVDVEPGDSSSRIFGIRLDGKIEIRFIDLKKFTPFDRQSQRRKLGRRLNDISGIVVSDSDSTLRGYPSIPIHNLSEDEVLNAFLNVFNWCIDEIRQTESK